MVKQPRVRSTEPGAGFLAKGVTMTSQPRLPLVPGGMSELDPKSAMLRAQSPTPKRGKIVPSLLGGEGTNAAGQMDMSQDNIPIEEPVIRGRSSRFLQRIIEPRVFGPLAGAAMMVLALFVIREIGSEIHLNDILSALGAVDLRTVALAFVFTLLSFAAMACYDVLAVRRVAPDKVPVRMAMFAGMIGYGISNAVGFHVFVGGPVRYRIYQRAGLDAADVGRVVGISFLTFLGGLAAVLGAALLFDPAGIPALHMASAEAERLIGAGILVVLACGIGWLARGNHQLTIFSWRFPLPTAGSAVAQIVIGAIDIGAAAAALYVLLPADVQPGFAIFLCIFVAAIIASVISHAPGGLGVLEATVLLGLGAGARPDIVAALLVFRVVYYLIPLALAASSLMLFEVYQVRHSVATLTGKTFALTRRIVPPIAATFVFLGGLVLLLSGNTPSVENRTDFLSDIVLLPFAEASHLLASLTGLLLVVLARGLYKRIALARIASITLLLAGAAFSLIKGLDWEEAAILCLMAAGLYLYRDAFYRRGDWRAFRPNPTWLALIAIVLASLTMIGFLAYQHVEYQTSLWWEFAWGGDAPRFLRATLAMGIVAAAIGIDALINKPTQPKVRGKTPIPDAVRTLIAESSDTTPSVALLGDKHFMLSTSHRAFLMYAVSGRSWITMGDPVGDAQPSRALIWRFAETADRAGARAVFYSIAPETLGNYLDLGLAILKIGEVARVDLPSFNLDGKSRTDFRYAHKRIAREGIEFSVLPKAEVPAVIDELRAVSDDWLQAKTGKEKGFSLGRFEDAYMMEFDCAVLKKDGAIVAFANLWRSGDKNELSIDLMRYKHGVSKVLMDALFAHIFLYGQQEGYKWFNLGAAPLSGLADHPLASTWSRVGTFIYRRGEEFYNFDGLRAFKQKFDPVWTPQYMACPGGLAMPQVLLEVTALIAGNPIGILKR